VRACAAFNANHDVLQEVVGMAIVMVPGRPRLDLPTLHEYLGERLATPKWPQCLVFMDGLPKSHTNKLLRVKLGERLGLPEFSDSMHPIDRTFEAKCPPQGTPLGDSIPSSPVVVSAGDVEEKLAAKLVTRRDQQLVVVPHPSRAGSLVCHALNVDRVEAIELARKVLDRYSVPSHFVEAKHRIKSRKVLAPPKTVDATASILQALLATGPVDPLVQGIQELFTDLLNLDYVPAPDANFFHLGGSSMLASQLASKIRKKFGVACSGAEVFQHASSNEMAQMVKHRNEDETDPSSHSNGSGTGSGKNNHGAPFAEDRIAPEPSFLGSLFQLVPMFIVFPIW
jgi:acyl carrier protein